MNEVTNKNKDQLVKLSGIIYSCISLLAVVLFSTLSLLYSIDYYIKPGEFLTTYIPQAGLIILICQIIILPILDIFILIFRERKIGRIIAITRLAIYFISIVISLVFLLLTDWSLWQAYPGLASVDIPLIVSRNLLPLLVNIPIVVSIFSEKISFKQWIGLISLEKRKQLQYVRLFNFIFFVLTFIEILLMYNLLHFNVIDFEDTRLLNYLIICTSVYYGWFILSEMLVTKIIVYSKQKQAKKLDDE